MTTPRHRFTVMPIVTALFVALAALPATAIVKVNAFGLGLEHEQAWRRPADGLRSALAFTRRTLKSLAESFGTLHRHALFRPAVMACVALAFLVCSHTATSTLFAIGAIAEGRHAGEFLIGERADGCSRDSITVLSGQDLAAGAVVGRVKYGIGRVSIPTVVGTGTGTASLVFAGPEVEVGNYVLTCITAVAHGGVFTLTTPSGKSLPNFTMTPGSTTATAYTSRHINFTITDATDFIVGDVFTFVVSTTVPTVIGGTGTGVLSALSLGPDAKPGNYKINNDVVVANGGDMTVTGPDGSVVGGRFVWSAAASTASFTSRQINFTISDATDYIVNNHFNVCVFNNLSGGKVVAWDPTTFDGRHKVAGLLLDNVDASSSDLAGVIVARSAAVIKDSLEWGAAITSSQKESAYADMRALGIIAR